MAKTIKIVDFKTFCPMFGCLTTVNKKLGYLNKNGDFFPIDVLKKTYLEYRKRMNKK